MELDRVVCRGAIGAAGVEPVVGNRGVEQFDGLPFPLAQPFQMNAQEVNGG